MEHYLGDFELLLLSGFQKLRPFYDNVFEVFHLQELGSLRWLKMGFSRELRRVVQGLYGLFLSRNAFGFLDFWFLDRAIGPF